MDMCMQENGCAMDGEITTEHCHCAHVASDCDKYLNKNGLCYGAMSDKVCKPWEDKLKDICLPEHPFFEYREKCTTTGLRMAATCDTDIWAIQRHLQQAGKGDFRREYPVLVQCVEDCTLDEDVFGGCPAFEGGDKPHFGEQTTLCEAATYLKIPTMHGFWVELFSDNMNTKDCGAGSTSGKGVTYTIGKWERDCSAEVADELSRCVAAVEQSEVCADFDNTLSCDCLNAIGEACIEPYMDCLAENEHPLLRDGCDGANAVRAKHGNCLSPAFNFCTNWADFAKHNNKRRHIMVGEYEQQGRMMSVYRLEASKSGYWGGVCRNTVNKPDDVAAQMCTDMGFYSGQLCTSCDAKTPASQPRFRLSDDNDDVEGTGGCSSSQLYTFECWAHDNTCPVEDIIECPRSIAEYWCTPASTDCESCEKTYDCSEYSIQWLKGKGCRVGAETTR
eukprot:TRINITY_DN67348_c4_g1_i1.p1 TRINITY_DN67348_c4_g1~~TRINITY_DN67348_c4_g1_i1.p1  ORF type:complete len:519 (+),score=62.77 TRINITY_DN67348_c4_g1_i1:217-1557(+)